MSQILRLHDSRDLEFIDNGVRSTQAVILHHGTPSTSLTWKLWMEEFRKLDIRAVGITRAGYGKSSRNRNATIGTTNADTTAVLNELGIVKFVSVGWSGGGPSALADALLENCIASHSIAGISNLQLQGKSFYTDMSEGNITDFEATLQGWDIGFAQKPKQVEEMHAERESGSAQWWAAREKIDRFRTDYDTFGLLLSQTMSDAVADGGLGWQDDESRIFGDWGFAFDHLNAPVHIWQGGLDTAVPGGHGRWLAENIPGATLTFYPDETHTSIMVERRAEIFDAIQKQLLKALSADVN
jgi:pimeloyl-ACP methyl ester carboxylesterase